MALTIRQFQDADNIRAAIKANGKRAITAQVLQSQLLPLTVPTLFDGEIETDSLYAEDFLNFIQEGEITTPQDNEDIYHFLEDLWACMSNTEKTLYFQLWNDNDGVAAYIAVTGYPILSFSVIANVRPADFPIQSFVVSKDEGIFEFHDVHYLGEPAWIKSTKTNSQLMASYGTFSNLRQICDALGITIQDQARLQAGAVAGVKTIDGVCLFAQMVSIDGALLGGVSHNANDAAYTGMELNVSWRGEFKIYIVEE